jgi:ferredoxin, 2Fe-2S
LKSIIRFEPHGKTIEVKKGTSFLAAAILADISIPHKCGGKGTCGTCKVRIQSESPLAPTGKAEKWRLSTTMIKEGYRLSCQCKVTGNAIVEVPEDPLMRIIRLQLEEKRRENRS